MAKEGGQPENTNAKKLKTIELKLEAYRQYCEHIAKGDCKKSWCFDHPNLTLTWITMEKYIAEDPVVFDPIQKEFAEARSYLHWLKLGKDMMTGEIPKCQPAIYQMFMRNKFKWDREDVQEIADCAADKILEKISKL
jgi:hypothetical protein